MIPAAPGYYVEINQGNGAIKLTVVAWDTDGCPMLLSNDSGVLRADSWGEGWSVAGPDQDEPVYAEVSAAVLEVDPLDPEAAAMQVLAEAMERLDTDARNRVIGYAHTRWYTSDSPADGPRTFWLDDLPATGDLICVDGRDLAISGVNVEVTSAGPDAGLKWRMTTRPVPTDAEGSEA